jgi:hypothetical protein
MKNTPLHRALQIEEQAKGLVAWIKEFVADATDNNGVSVYDDLDQFVEDLGSVIDTPAEPIDIYIPDMLTGETVVKVVDELKYRVKPGASRGVVLAQVLNNALNGIIITHDLDGDPHAFASMPESKGEGAGFTAPIAIQAEGARIGISSCLCCGAAIMLDPQLDMLKLHRTKCRRSRGFQPGLEEHLGKKMEVIDEEAKLFGQVGIVRAIVQDKYFLSFYTLSGTPVTKRFWFWKDQVRFVEGEDE